MKLHVRFLKIKWLLGIIYGFCRGCDVHTLFTVYYYNFPSAIYIIKYYSKIHEFFTVQVTLIFFILSHINIHINMNILQNFTPFQLTFL